MKQFENLVIKRHRLITCNAIAILMFLINTGFVHFQISRLPNFQIAFNKPLIHKNFPVAGILQPVPATHLHSLF